MDAMEIGTPTLIDTNVAPTVALTLIVYRNGNVVLTPNVEHDIGTLWRMGRRPDILKIMRVPNELAEEIGGLESWDGKSWSRIHIEN